LLQLAAAAAAALEFESMRAAAAAAAALPAGGGQDKLDLAAGFEAEKAAATSCVTGLAALDSEAVASARAARRVFVARDFAAAFCRSSRLGNREKMWGDGERGAGGVRK